MNYAPIVLFVYNRPWHTKQTVEALKQNVLATESDLIVYSDAAKKEHDYPKVAEARSYLRKISGFKSVTIVERETNWGLAASIIDGVTHIVNKHGKVIVLEDDILTSPYFLKYMNDALAFYEGENKVWHISGWNYPIHTEGLEDTFLWRVMNCWGWATWVDRWTCFEKNVDKTMQEFCKVDVRRFNLDGYHDFWSQIVANKAGKINTWAIFWYATIFKHNGLCLNPTQTFVKNIGHDGSGVNCCANTNHNDSPSLSCTLEFTRNFEESSIHVARIKKLLDSSIIKKVKRLFRCI